MTPDDDTKVGYAAAVSAGGVVIAVVMILILPAAVMLGGALWAFAFGALAVDAADRRADGESPASE